MGELENKILEIIVEENNSHKKLLAGAWVATESDYRAAIAIASLIESEKKKVWDAAREKRYIPEWGNPKAIENKYTDYQEYINKK